MTSLLLQNHFRSPSELAEHTLTHTINSEMLELSNWFKVNKLSLNVIKSNYVIFKPSKRRGEFDLNIKINHKMIRVKKLRFLVLFWMKTFHGKQISHILLSKFLNLLVLLVDPLLGFNITY